MTKEQPTAPPRRRQDPRVPLDKRVSVRFGDWAPLTTWGHDVSRGGIKLSMPAETSPGDRITVTLTLPNSLQMDLRAEVRFVLLSESPGECIAGLCWVSPKSEEIELLHSLIAELTGQPAPEHAYAQVTQRVRRK